MPERGQVLAVAWMDQGSELVADAPVGSTVLSVSNAVDFDDDGGTLVINGAQLDYASSDQDNDTITLDAPLAVAASEGDRVLLWGGGQLVTDYIAFVSLDDGDEVEVPIPYEQRDMWPEGEYADPVMVDLADDLESIVGVPGRTPMRDGTFIDPTTLPDTGGTDGNPPGVSPAATVIGGIGALFVKWPAILNADPVTYEVHLSTASGFAPGPTTLAAQTSATQITLRTMPDGSPLLYLDANHETVPYFARIIAKDDDGAAAPGVEGFGSMVQVTGPDVAAAYVYAGTLLADQIIGGDISADVTVSGLIKTSDQGQRVEIASSGITLWAPDGITTLASLPTDPSLPVFIKGQAELDRTIINGNFALRGTTNEVSQNSVLQLAGKVSDPQTPPTPQINWDAVDIPWLDDSAQCFGLQWVPTLNCFTTAWWLYGAGLFLIGADGGYGGNVGFPDRPGTEYFGPLGGHVWTDATHVVVLGYGTDKSDAKQYWELRRYTWNGSTFSYTNYLRVGSVGSSFNNKNPALGLDSAGGIQMTWHSSGSTPNQLQSQAIDPVSLARGTTTVLSPTASPQGTVQDVGFSQRTSADVGAYSTFVAYRSGGTRIFGGYQGIARNTGLDFPVANSGRVSGAVFGGPGNRFYSLDATGVLTSYSDNKWTTESSKWYAAFTLYDSDPAGTGLHESGPSVFAPFTMSKRANLSLTAPTIPDNDGADDPDSVRFYLGRGTSPPGSGSMFLNSTPDAGVRSAVIKAATFAGTTAPASNFPSAGAAKVIDAAGNVLMNALGYSMFAPTGVIEMYGGSVASPPTGWLICNGQLVSRTIYAALFAVIGTSFGAGDGTTTFAVPNMLGRFPRGSSTPGGTGGADTVTMPDHTHPVLSHDHGLASATTAAVPTGSGGGQRMTGAGTTGSRTTDTGAVTGTNPPINNVPSYLNLAYIIKT